MKYVHWILAGALCIALLSCEKDEKKTPLMEQLDNGIIILNEGTFLNNNASVSFYSDENDRLINNLFQQVNQVGPGDVITSYTKVGDYGFLVVNNSGKVEIVDKKTFEVAAAPIVASYPRYVLGINNEKAYLTNGTMQGYVYIISLSSLTITDSIEVGYGPEMMVMLDNKVYVANSGGYMKDSTISVINIDTDELIENIYVGDVPSQLVLDNENNLWVACRGYALYEYVEPYALISETEAKLVKVNTGSNQVEWEETIGMASEFIIPPKISMSLDDNQLYCLLPGGIYQFDVTQTTFPDNPLLSGSFTGITENPYKTEIFVFSGDYVSAGKCSIYSTTGTLQKEFTVGVLPAGAIF